MRKLRLVIWAVFKHQNAATTVIFIGRLDFQADYDLLPPIETGVKV